MFNLQEELSKIDFNKVKVTVPRPSGVDNDLLRTRALAREKLKQLGVEYDVFSDKKIRKKDYKRFNEYNNLIREAEQILISGKNLSKDMENKIREESKWYNKEVLDL